LLAHDFIRNALLAGTPIALACGAVGYFVVLRSQVFAGDALSHVAFTGALAAAAAGVDLRLGLFASTVFIAALLAAIGGRARMDDVTIGIVFVWVLGLGVFFLDLFNRGANGGNGIVASRTLFGSIFDLTTGQAQLAALIGIAVLLALSVIARPLLFATVDPQVAAARGVPVAVVGAVFLVLLGIDAAEATQAVGALLLLGLIAAPAGAAIKLTARPYLALALSCLFALASVWLGVTAAYLIGSLPPSTAILGVAAILYASSFAVSSFNRSNSR
jgi:zinc/manganese transport system permease protein